MKHILYIIVILTVVCSTAQAQDYRRAARKGNSLYKENKYSDAEVEYRRSLAQDSTFYKAQYNLGNALYKKKEYTQAKKYFAKAAQAEQANEKERSAALHNMGNCALQEGLAVRDTNPEKAIKSYQEAVEAYKNSLRVSDKNNNTKYNLAMAQQLLKQLQQQQNQNNQQQQNQQNQNQQNQDKQKQQQNKDQNKDQQQQQQNQKNNDQQDKQNKDKQKQQQQQQQKQEQKKKADAERMLEALKNKEKNTLEKQKVKIPAGGRVEKDW